MHLVLDAARIVEADGPSLRTIDRWLHTVARFRDRGELQIAPLRDLPAFLHPETTPTRLHSILRPAA